MLDVLVCSFYPEDYLITDPFEDSLGQRAIDTELEYCDKLDIWKRMLRSNDESKHVVLFGESGWRRENREIRENRGNNEHTKEVYFEAFEDYWKSLSMCSQRSQTQINLWNVIDVDKYPLDFSAPDRVLDRYKGYGLLEDRNSNTYTLTVEQQEAVINYRNKKKGEEASIIPAFSNTSFNTRFNTSSPASNTTTGIKLNFKNDNQTFTLTFILLAISIFVLILVFVAKDYYIRNQKLKENRRTRERVTFNTKTNTVCSNEVEESGRMNVENKVINVTQVRYLIAFSSEVFQNSTNL